MMLYVLIILPIAIFLWVMILVLSKHVCPVKVPDGLYKV